MVWSELITRPTRRSERRGRGGEEVERKGGGEARFIVGRFKARHLWYSRQTLS